MWFVQRMHEHILFQSSSIAPCWCLQEDTPPPELSGSRVLGFPYCDNMSVIGTNPNAVLQERLRIQQAFESAGFAMHEETGAEPLSVVLGAQVDGKTGLGTPTKTTGSAPVGTFVGRQRPGHLWLRA